MTNPPKRLVRKNGRPKKRKGKFVVQPPRAKKDLPPHLWPLSDRDEAVLDEYFSNGMVKSAALKACGYAKSTAETRSWQFFQHPKIVRAIAIRRSRMKSKLAITEEETLQHWARIGYMDLGDLIARDENGEWFLDLDLMTPEQRSAISEFSVEEREEGPRGDKQKVTKVKVKTHSKTAALEALSKHLGIYQDVNVIAADQEVMNALMAGRKRSLPREAQDVVDVEFEDVTPGVERKAKKPVERKARRRAEA